ncbi:MAG: Glycosyl transferase family 2 [Candidatus Wolfebacteria bacterium GW2011_GWC2_46_275]|uniref:dolichyl-phosphate beta-glucosyltransferase n=2 Tax=Candidatus Wolfeibacteriota TaxID=1752735 RepID=A0A0G1X869_9BACT|nr:MAG: family 2 glycosyl transferase [Candidatus Wolfebacteria bacterium GW2011_GWB1_47_1]KKU35786.1 MAG: Glycosyl transferase family 2 [Candidatus Wolfebacteria bacterium GW2011_GWC2_46_275]KKU42113.1 MAG: Glycosyl transferase family 2 [Candidatus Wolfebacteria bacterium GW2011_GWB2_46_69]KKU53441.1 MAG: Glycosyl transferase family 2 [Candidatus Wolfebacteria bacterium GW2011_GWC1_47_103]KKU59298.1 MAG: Glycosyl transferase family 2 [Candidatus Wolfebacteria bacterium GW2011_GWE2_47_12]KKU66
MDKKPRLSIIIPAYNEAKRLPLTLVDMKRHLETVDFSYEVIVVDNGSKDNTVDIVLRFEHLWNELRLIECAIKGKGAAVQKGMEEAKGEFRAFVDADNSISIDQVIEALKLTDKGYDIVIGSRDIEGAKRDQPLFRKLPGKMGNWFIQLMVLPGLKDTQCPFKIFSERAANEIFPIIKVKHWGFDVEILSLAKRLGYKIKETPAIFINDPNSRIKLSSYIEVLWEVCKVRWWLWTNTYKIKSKKLKSKNK